jgi:hypothetical protein
VICLWASDDFITNNPLQLLYYDEKLNHIKGHYGPITFHNISQLNDQNMLKLTPMEHDTKPKTQCIKQLGKKWSLLLHDINDVMHIEKHKIGTSNERVHKPKHFHWQPIHNNELYEI